MEFRECRIYKAITEERVDKVAAKILELTEAGRDVNIRHEEDARTFLHVVLEDVTKFSDPRALPVVYQLCRSGIDVNAKERMRGETVLHQAATKVGTHSILVALLRCGADPLIEDDSGATVEDILLEERPEGWQEKLHWYQKFKPGLYNEVMGTDPDVGRVERLLKSWCRVVMTSEGSTISLASEAQRKDVNTQVVDLLHKYKDQNEMVIAALAGAASTVNKYLKKGLAVVDTCDISYQYYFREYMVAPRPLVVAAWEQDSLSLMEVVLSHNPDLSMNFNIHHQGETPKPLFFHLVSSRLSPMHLKNIKTILSHCDLKTKDAKGRTVLYEAVAQCCPLKIFTHLLQSGADISSRDGFGETVRDYALRRGRNVYVGLIDDHVKNTILNRDVGAVEAWIWRDYEHILTVVKQDSLLHHKVHEDINQFEMRNLLRDIPNVQNKAIRMFKAVDRGSFDVVVKTAPSGDLWRCQNKCGQTILHRALLSRDQDSVIDLVQMFPELLQIPDNMSRYPLHYAYLLLDEEDLATQLISLGGQEGVRDVLGRVPSMYRRESSSPSFDHQRMLDDVTQFEERVRLQSLGFRDKLLDEIETGDVRSVRKLVQSCDVGRNIRQYSRALFRCVDAGKPEVAEYLIKAGCDPDIWKEYEHENKTPGTGPSSGHVSLQERANQYHYQGLASLIAQTLTEKERCEVPGRQHTTPFEHVSMSSTAVSEKQGTGSSLQNSTI